MPSGSWLANDWLWPLGLGGIGLFIGWMALSVQRAIDQAGRCPKCLRKVSEFQLDLSSRQIVCPYCRFAVGKLLELPLADGHLLQPRQYRFSGVSRQLSLLVVALCCLGLMLLIGFSETFRGIRVIQAGLLGVVTALLAWMWARWSQTYVVTEAGITSQNVFRKRHVQWNEIQRAIRLSGGDGPDSLGLYTTRKRRWAWPRLMIPESIQNFDELKGLIIFKAGLTDTTKRGWFSTETYEKLTPKEDLRTLV